MAWKSLLRAFTSLLNLKLYRDWRHIASTTESVLQGKIICYVVYLRAAIFWEYNGYEGYNYNSFECDRYILLFRYLTVYGGLYQKSWTSRPIFPAKEVLYYPNKTLKKNPSYSDAYI